MPILLTLNLAVKLVGSALLLASSVAFNLRNVRRDGERLRRLSAQIAFVRFVRDRIERFLTPIGEIIRDCDGAILDDMLLGCSEAEFHDTASLRAVLRGGAYYSDGGRVFDSFLADLGSSYREDEVSACNAFIKDTEALLGKLRTELPKESKSRSVLSFCFVAAIVIILF
jgi:hypothetical protein